ncbi:MAG: DinB family protein [Planctomycetes bacterium]|nr:DinB family protein [Planctomycetota bacterium]
MTTTSTLSPIDPGLAALAFSHSAILKLAEDITDEQLTTRSGPKANHAAWILGHLAYANDSFCIKLHGQESVLPENYKTLFGMGSTPTDDAADYPSKAELLEALNKSHEFVVGWFKSLSDEQLASPLPEEMEMFGPNHASLASTMVWHEGIHQGQLIEVRRILGLPRAFG